MAAENTIYDSKGKILRVYSVGTKKLVDIEITTDDQKSHTLTIANHGLERVFNTETLDIDGEIRYNKGEGIVKEGDVVFLKFNSLPLPGTIPLYIDKDTFEEEVRSHIPEEVHDDFINSSSRIQSISPYTFQLGTAKFFIPPLSIRLDRLNTGERIPVLRNKGSIKKNAGRSDIKIQVRLFFSGKDSINDPDNGLRALIAMFTKTPFVPVKNHYLNAVHGIDAVCLHDLSLDTVPGFPDCLSVTLTLLKFNYIPYMISEKSFDVDEKLFKWHYKRNLINSDNPILEAFSGTGTDKLSFSYLPSEIMENVKKERQLSKTSDPEYSYNQESSLLEYANKDIETLNRIDQILFEMSNDKSLTSIKRDNVHGIKLDKSHSGIFDTKRISTVFFVSFSHPMNGGGENPLLVEIDNPFQYASRKFLANTTAILTIDKKTKTWSAKSQALIDRLHDTLREATHHLSDAEERIKAMYYTADEVRKNMVPWPGLEDTVITGVQISKRNTFARHQILGSEHPTYQYLGSQDSFIKLDIEVFSEESLMSIKNLFEFVNAQARNYSFGFSSGFLRIRNRIANLFGVHNVLVDSMTVNTIPNFPGRYLVELMLVDFDTIQSFREKGHEIVKDGHEYILRASNDKIDGSPAIGKATANLNNRNMYFEWALAMRLMRHIDLYPDLDLPTYEEVKAGTGIDLPNPFSSIYVDPDFYIIQRSTIEKHIKNALDEEIEYSVRDFFNQKITSKIGRDKEVLLVETDTIYTQEDLDELTKESVEYFDRDPFLAEAEKQQLVRIIKEQISEVNNNPRTLYNNTPIPDWVGFSLATLESDMRLYGDDGKTVYKSEMKDKYDINTVLYGPMQLDANSLSGSFLQRIGLSSNWIWKNASPDKFTSKEIEKEPEKNVKFAMQLMAKKHDETISSDYFSQSYISELKKNQWFSRLADILDREDFLWVVSIVRYKNSPYPQTKRSDKPDAEILSRLGRSIYESVLIGKYIYAGEDRGKLGSDEIQFINRKERAVEQRKDIDLISERASLGDQIPSSENVWYDTTRYSKKGSMIRAFPTVYMFIVDEGKYVKWAKMWDDFLGMNSLTNLSINRSRKRAADTCLLSMTNMYKAFGGRNRGLTDRSNYTKTGFWDFLFPRITKEMEEGKSFSFGSMTIEPGARLHVRMGYGNNLLELPIVFNGTVTELEIGDTVDILAQGDGIELTNTLRFDKDETFGHLGMGYEPENTIARLLVLGDDGGFFYALGEYTGWHRWMGGKSNTAVTHFGDPDFIGPFTRPSEMMQNVYPGNGTGVPENQNLWTFFSEDEPNLQIDVHRKSSWDIIQILTAAIPNYISAVHPFEFRSTLFYGKPWWDLAFGYEISRTEPSAEAKGNAIWKKYGDFWVSEKKKPYRQWHMYSSFDDIIDNKIKATSEGMYTNVIATYRKSYKLNDDNPGTGQMIAYADRSIYPQFQKTTYIDSEIYSKAPLSLLSNIWLVKYVLQAIPYGLGYIQSKTATDHMVRNIAEGTVVDYMKDMYQGHMLVIGDPTVKPHDAMYIGDLYNEMLGTCLVKEVTHTISVDTGFVTSIKPDCAVGSNDDKETPHWISGGAVGSRILSIYGAEWLAKTVSDASRVLSSVPATLVMGTIVAALGGTTGILIAAGAVTLCIVDKTVDEIFGRVKKKAQCVFINLLTYQGKEFSAGITGHNGISIGVTSTRSDLWQRYVSLLPDFMTGDIGDRLPQYAFGQYSQEVMDQTLYQDYASKQYGMDNLYNLDPQVAATLSKYVDGSNRIVQTAMSLFGASYGEVSQGGITMDTLGFIKEVLRQNGLDLKHSSIEELWKDRESFYNVNPGKELGKEGSVRTAKQLVHEVSVFYVVPDEAKVGDIVFFDSAHRGRPDFIGILAWQNGARSRFFCLRPPGKNSPGTVQLTEEGDMLTTRVYGVLRPIITSR